MVKPMNSARVLMMALLMSMGAVLCFVQDLRAQPFEYLYGAANARESALSGTATTTISGCGGGYIAVGEKVPTSGGTADVYLVRTNGTGARIWEYAYDIRSGQNSGTDAGRSIVELPNGAGFVLTGYTNVAGNYDVLVMKIACDGSVVYTRTYGSNSDDKGYDIALSAINPNEVIIVGETSGSGSNTRDGLVLKLNHLTGGVTFMQAYDNNGNDDELRGVIETSANNAGDIVAVGTTEDPINLAEGWAIRLPANGILPGPGTPYGSLIVGGTQNDHFYSVIERQLGTSAGNLVISGAMSSFSPNGQYDVYLLEKGPYLCDPTVADRKIGDDVAGNTYEEYGLDLVEVTTPPPGSGLVIGDLVITGTTTYGHALGQYEAFILGVGLGFVPKLPSQLFGDHGTNIDISFSIDETGNGYIMGGWSEYHPFDNTDPRDLYLIRTNASGMTCCDIPWSPIHWQLMLEGNCNVPTRNVLTQNVVRTGNRSEMTTPVRACTTQCSFPKTNLDIGTTGTDNESVGSIRAFPNPIALGGTVALEYTEVLESTLVVTVSNALGKTIHTETVEVADKSALVSLSTTDWLPGSYIVEVKAGQHKDVIKLVVTD